MNITWLGHSAFVLDDGDSSVIIDPFLSGNPKSAPLPPSVAPSAILVTHGHYDHLGDALRLSTEFQAPVVGVSELAGYCAAEGVANERVNYGGSISLGAVTIQCVPAFHTSSIGPERIHSGSPCGFVVSIGGFTVYHAGDTSLFGDMELIGKEHALDVALLPIGGRFTMDPRAAVIAATLLQPRVVIPMHFNTFPPIEQDVDLFARAVASQTSALPVVLEPGQSHALGAGVQEGASPGP